MNPAADSEFFVPGDWVAILEGAFAGAEGEVIQFARERDLVRVEITIDGQRFLAEFGSWQVELV